MFSESRIPFYDEPLLDLVILFLFSLGTTSCLFSRSGSPVCSIICSNTISREDLCSIHTFKHKLLVVTDVNHVSVQMAKQDGTMWTLVRFEIPEA